MINDNQKARAAEEYVYSKYAALRKSELAGEWNHHSTARYKEIYSAGYEQGQKDLVLQIIDRAHLADGSLTIEIAELKRLAGS